MKTFNSPFHTIADEYPESSFTSRFGRGYQFASKPNGPDQIVTRLDFPALFWMKNVSTGLIDRAVAPHYNIANVIDFYEEHRLHGMFQYQHPTRGLTVWRFAKPLVTPRSSGPDKIGGIPGFPGFTAHQVDPLQLEFILQP